MGNFFRRASQCFALAPRVLQQFVNDIKSGVITRFIRASWEARGLTLHSTACLYYEAGNQIEVGGKCWLGAFSIIIVASDSRGGGGKPHLSLGQSVYIGDHCNIRAAGGVIRMGDNVLIGNHVTMVASNHGLEKSKPMSQQPWANSPLDVIIGSDVWIGANVVLLPGTRVGDGSVVAAGAVVRGEIQPYSIVGGVPARIIKTRL